MARIHIGRGTIFLLNNRKYEIINEIEKDTFLAKDLEFGNVEEKFTLFTLLRHLQEGNLQFSVQGKNSTSDKIGMYDFEDFSMLPQELQDEANFRFEAIEPLLSLNVKSLNPYIKARADELKRNGKPVSKASLYRWLKAYSESDDGLLSLVPSIHKRGVKDTKLDREVEMIIDKIIDEKFLVREKRTIKTISELVENEIHKENEKKEINERFSIPSIATIRRRILARDPYTVEKARKGANAIRGKYKQVQYHEKPTYPLQRVEMDHTQLDIIVLDDNTLKEIGRPYITNIMDVYTGYPLGVNIGFEPPSYASVMLALMNAILPKTNIKEKYPNVNNEWLAYGLPETLWVDNGKEFLSKHLKEACNQLKIKLEKCPVKAPWYKGAIERHFRTINQQFLHQAPGTTFSNVKDKGDYNPKKKATIRWSKFLELYHVWLLDYYCQSYNKGVRGAPAKLWGKAFEDIPRPDVPPSMLDWKIKLMKVGFGSIQHFGVRRLHLNYQAKEFTAIRHSLEKNGKKNRVKYKFDPMDLSKIYVFDEMNQKYIEAKCTDEVYSNGLNEYSHRVYLNELKEAEKEVNSKALAATKAKMIELMESEAPNQSMKARKKNKRMEGENSVKVLNQEPQKTEVKNLEKNKQKASQKTRRVVDMFYTDIENDWGDFNVK